MTSVSKEDRNWLNMTSEVLLSLSFISNQYQVGALEPESPSSLGHVATSFWAKAIQTIGFT